MLRIPLSMAFARFTVESADSYWDHLQFSGTLAKMARSTHNRKRPDRTDIRQAYRDEKAPSRHQYGQPLSATGCAAVGLETNLEVPTGNLTSNNTKSCGCLNHDARQRKHPCSESWKNGTSTWNSLVCNEKKS